MSRLTTIFRRRGGDSGPGQETKNQTAAATGAGSAPQPPGFRDRGKLRRRLRYLRRVRDLELRDLGGLVYETYRQKRPRQELVERKVRVLAATDKELSGLELALNDRRPLRELRMPGIGGQCPRCGEVYGSAARFCSNCGAGLAGEAEAALGQFGRAPAAPRPAAAPAAAPPGSVLANWSAAGAIPPAAPPPGSAPRPASAAPGGGPAPSEPKPATPGGAPAAAPDTPAAAPSGPPSSAPAPAGDTPAPANATGGRAPAPSGRQGIGSGDPLGQGAAPARSASGKPGMGSGDPLGQSAPATPPQPAMSSGDPLAAGPAQPRADEAAPDRHPGPEDETVIMRAGDDQPGANDDPSRNGADESRAARAPAARAPDDPE
jgi:hypothetical protein